MTNREIRELIHNSILNHITNHMFRYLLSENITPAESEDLVDSLYGLSMQKNLSAITNKEALDGLFHFLMMDRKQWCRWDFIHKLTASLKFELGDEKTWDGVINDLYNALLIEYNVDTKNKTNASLLSEINRNILKPNIEILRQNHWLVTIILIGLYPDIHTHISARYIECQEILTQGRRRRG